MSQIKKPWLKKQFGQIIRKRNSYILYVSFLTEVIKIILKSQKITKNEAGPGKVSLNGKDDLKVSNALKLVKDRAK